MLHTGTGGMLISEAGLPLFFYRCVVFLIVCFHWKQSEVIGLSEEAGGDVQPVADMMNCTDVLMLFGTEMVTEVTVF